MTRERWERKTSALEGMFLAFMAPLLALLYASASDLPFANRSAFSQTMFFLMLIMVFVQIVMAVVLLVHLIGRSYRNYFFSLIEYNEEICENVRVEICTFGMRTVLKANDSYLDEYLIFSDYDVEVVIRETPNKKPKFIIKNGVITKVVLPYVENIENKTWHGYCTSYND